MESRRGGKSDGASASSRHRSRHRRQINEGPRGWAATFTAEQSWGAAAEATAPTPVPTAEGPRGETAEESGGGAAEATAQAPAHAAAAAKMM